MYLPLAVSLPPSKIQIARIGEIVGTLALESVAMISNSLQVGTSRQSTMAISGGDDFPPQSA